ncbi:MAG TPA: hypothetical protein VNX00_13665 [Herbaspirillum sp.]|nr:hypothetical protein [Herbaspirillum sp.]
MDPLAPRLPPNTYEKRSVAEGGTQPNEGCCIGFSISFNRIVETVRSFFPRINGPAQNPSGRPRLSLSRPDEAAPAESAAQFTPSKPSTDSTQYAKDVKAYKKTATDIFEKEKAIAIQKAREECEQLGVPFPERREILPLEGNAPSNYAVQYEQDKQDKRVLTIDLFIKQLAITIEAAKKQCREAISALALSFQDQELEISDPEKEVSLSDDQMPAEYQKMTEDARKILDDFEKRFPEDIMKCNQNTDITQRLWSILYSMDFKSKSDAVYPPEFEKIMQDVFNKIPEYQFLGIAGGEINTKPGIVTRGKINRLCLACFQDARTEKFAALREQDLAILRRLNDDQFKTVAKNYASDFLAECKRLSSTAGGKKDFVSDVLVQAHKNVKIRVESYKPQETLRMIDEMLAASITPTMLLAKMSSAAAVAPAISPEMAQINTAPSTPKPKPNPHFLNLNRLRS